MKMDCDLFFPELERLCEQMVFSLEFFALLGELTPRNFQLVERERFILDRGDFIG